MFSCTRHVFLTMLYGVLYRIWPFTFLQPYLIVKIETIYTKSTQLKKTKNKVWLHKHDFTIQKILVKEEKQLYVSRTCRTKKQVSQLDLTRIKDSFIRVIVHSTVFIKQLFILCSFQTLNSLFSSTVKFHERNFVHDNKPDIESSALNQTTIISKISCP